MRSALNSIRSWKLYENLIDTWNSNDKTGNIVSNLLLIGLRKCKSMRESCEVRKSKPTTEGAGSIYVLGIAFTKSNYCCGIAGLSCSLPTYSSHPQRQSMPTLKRMSTMLERLRNALEFNRRNSIVITVDGSERKGMLNDRIAQKNRFFKRAAIIID